MVALVVLLLILLLLGLTPWQRLPMAGRLWTVAALINTLVFLGMPTTAATSPWRPVVARVLASSAATSLGLLILGLILRRYLAPLGMGGRGWAAPLILGAVPIAFYTFFWIIGPLY
jgi:hypothetical protein